MNSKIKDLPDEYRKDILKAVEILTEEGCKGIYLFGSLAQGSYRKKSDIDIAVETCPSGKFFNIYGKLILNLDHEVDLIDLSKQKEFREHLARKKELVNVG